MARTKVTILGGGMAGLTTAYELTRTPELRERFEVTLYQMGWRPGGKLASGRGPHGRNEEHGLHVWFGFYDNAFALLRDCYNEWKRSADNPLQSWRDAMKPRSYIPCGGLEDGQWTYVPVLLPENSDTPGDGKDCLTPWGAIATLLSLLKDVLGARYDDVDTRDASHLHVPGWITSLFNHAMAGWNDDSPGHPAQGQSLPDEGARLHVSSVLDKIHRWFQSFEDEVERYPASHHRALSWMLREFQALDRRVTPTYGADDTAHHAVSAAVDVTVAMVAGLLDSKYGILEHGDIMRINTYEFSEWLLENGASSNAVNWIARLLYDTGFQYEDGDVKRPNMEAGSAVLCVLRLLCTYKGAFLFVPSPGMGDAVIAPIYQVLCERGVKFQFFHKVTRLELSADKSKIQRVHLDQQVRLKSGPYSPLIQVGKLCCFPAQPDWKQIVDGDLMETAGLNLESKWDQWPAAGTSVLESGVDFDQVVLALSLGAIKRLNEEPSVCGELIAGSPRFADAVENLRLVPALSLQLWLTKDLNELGFDYKRAETRTRPNLVSAPWQFTIWADMSQVLEFEEWKVPAPPRSVHYLCGVYHLDLHRAPSTERNVEARARSIVREESIRWLRENGPILWPKGADASKPPAIDWEVLWDELRGRGEQRIDAQYLRSNVSPTEVCVGSHKNTSRYRLRSDESGFQNLYLAGAWIWTGLNVESVEAAVMSGMQAARAISGSPGRIVGEHFFQPEPKAAAGES